MCCDRKNIMKNIIARNYVFTDKKNTFDSLDPEYIDEVLNLFNVWPNFKSLSYYVYNNAKGCIVKMVI